MLASYVLPIVRENTEPLLLIGIDPILDRSLHSWEMQHPESEADNSWLDLIKEPYTVFCPGNWAKRFSFSPGIISLWNTSTSGATFALRECSPLRGWLWPKAAWWR